MGGWAAGFLALALVAGFLGFGGFEGGVGNLAWVGQLLLGVFVALALMVVILRQRGPVG